MFSCHNERERERECGQGESAGRGKLARAFVSSYYAVIFRLTNAFHTHLFSGNCLCRGAQWKKGKVIVCNNNAAYSVDAIVEAVCQWAAAFGLKADKMLVNLL